MKALTACAVLCTLVSFPSACSKHQDPPITESEAKPEIEPTLAPPARVDLGLEVEREMLALERDRLALDRAEWEQSKQSETAEPSSSQVPVSQPEENAAGRADFSLFFEELQPHGSWFDTAEFGYVWQPAMAHWVSDWRPYTRGTWVYTDWGWTWCSDEPFGWATYHYGRWTLLQKIGWVWVPGTDWAPAWVSWRVCPSYIGWAPLPPITVFEININFGSDTDTYCGISPSHYCFVPVGVFVEPVQRHCLPPERNRSIFRETRNVTQIHSQKERIIVEGPNPEWFRARSGGNLPRHTLCRVPWTREWHEKGAPGKDGRVELAGPAIDSGAHRPLKPHHVEGKFERVGASQTEAQPDPVLVRKFARERAKQVLQARKEVEHPPKQEVGSGPEKGNARRDPQAIRTSIAEREGRLKELLRQQAEQQHQRNSAVPNMRGNRDDPGPAERLIPPVAAQTDGRNRTLERSDLTKPEHRQSTVRIQPSPSDQSVSREWHGAEPVKTPSAGEENRREPAPVEQARITEGHASRDVAPAKSEKPASPVEIRTPAGFPGRRMEHTGEREQSPFSRMREPDVKRQAAENPGARSGKFPHRESEKIQGEARREGPSRESGMGQLFRREKPETGIVESGTTDSRKGRGDGPAMQIPPKQIAVEPNGSVPAVAAEPPQRERHEEPVRQVEAKGVRQGDGTKQSPQEEAVKQAQAEAVRQAEAMKQAQQEDAAKQAQAEAARQAEAMKQAQQEDAAKQAQAEAARQAEAMKQALQEDAAKQAQAEAARQAEAMKQAQQEEAARQAQAEAARQAEAMKRAQQEEAARLAQAEAARQAEAMKQAQQEEAARQARAEAARQAEAMRRAQEEAQRAEAARRAQEEVQRAEAMRRAQEEAQRAEAARRAQEEAARQAEAMRRAQEEAAKQAEAARRAQEEAAKRPGGGQ